MHLNLINSFLFISLAHSALANAAAPALCHKGEAVVATCSNPAAGLGLDNIVVAVCKDKKSQEVTLSSSRVLSLNDGKESKVDLRISAELELGEQGALEFTAYDYTEVYKLEYRPASKDADYSVEHGASGVVRAKLTCGNRSSRL